MNHFSITDIEGLDKIFRLNLINSCTGYKSANLIGTKSKAGISNVAVFSSVTHFGSNPAILGFVLRPATVPRNTYANILETGYYTINHIFEDIISDAHHTSAKYSEEVSEFNQTSLIEEYKPNFKTPFVFNSPVQIGMRFLEEMPIQINGTILILGEVIDLFVREDLLQKDGFIDLTKGKTATINGLDAYAIPSTEARFDYQRPKTK